MIYDQKDEKGPFLPS